MRMVVLACLLAGCGGSSPPSSSASRATPAPTARAPRRITRADMLASLPADAKVVFAVNVTKLRHSGVARRGWALLKELAALQELIETMCGALDDIRYGLVALKDTEGHESWGWLHGINRDAKLTCV